MTSLPWQWSFSSNPITGLPPPPWRSAEKWMADPMITQGLQPQEGSGLWFWLLLSIFNHSIPIQGHTAFFLLVLRQYLLHLGESPNPTKAKPGRFKATTHFWMTHFWPRPYKKSGCYSFQGCLHKPYRLLERNHSESQDFRLEMQKFNSTCANGSSTFLLPQMISSTSI